MNSDTHEWTLPRPWYWYRDHNGWHADTFDGSAHAFWDRFAKTVTGSAPEQIVTLVERRNTDG